MEEELTIQNDYKNINIKPTMKKKRRWLKWLIWMFLLVVICSGGGLIAAYLYYSKDLPKISSLNDYTPPIITTVFSDDNRKIGEFYTERRIVMPLANIPKQLINAFIAAEDSRFYKHQGIDFISIVRAFFRNIEAGTIVQGGSTITQQVTKSFFLSPERSYHRKIKEAILAFQIDSKLSKEDILFLYLNQIYLGHGAYGVEAAAENYFDKTCKELNLAESALLAGLPQAPSRYSPFHNLKKAKERQIYVLNRMVAENFITNAEATEAIEYPIEIKPKKNWYIEEVPYYTEYVRLYIEEKYGRDMLYKNGLKIYTSVNIEMQKSAREAIEQGLRNLDKRQGYRGPIEKLDKSKIETVSETIQKEWNENSPTINDIVKGIAVEVSNNQVSVRMGEQMGIIPLKNMDWARKPNPRRYYYVDKIRNCKKALNVGDLIWVKLISKDKDEKNWILDLEQIPIAQAALICLESETGNVKAMIGGRDFTESQFNRAIQSRRQPGSAFKPIVYAAALDRGPSIVLTEKSFEDLKLTGVSDKILKKIETIMDLEYDIDDRLFKDLEMLLGVEDTLTYKSVILENADRIEKKYTPATIVYDSPIVFKDTARQFVWKPKNYEKTFYGPTRIREALAHSRNVVTIKILQDIGVDYVIDYASKLGISSPINRDLSIALGSSGVSLLEITNAYAVFSNLGDRVDPLFIKKIEDRNDEVLEFNMPVRKHILEKSTAYCMNNMLQSVVKEGTAKKVSELKRPIAGKTGTTNNLYDAWFIGYTPKYVVGVWVGFDQKGSLGKGETGSQAAVPIWMDFMRKIMKDKPTRVFPVPKGVVFKNIDADTGLLAIPESKSTIFECFKEGTEPAEYSPKPDKINDKSMFFKENM